ncbi:MAG: 4Fe-4S dicluster domain-containing protein, partial [Planctomycetota bacterium]
DSHSELELLATLMGESSTDGYEIVRNTYAERTNLPRTIPGSIVANPDFEKRWRRCLHDGHDTQSIGAIAAEAPRVRSDVVGRMITMATQAATMTDGIDVVFAPCAKVHDGRFANNGWLQELPGGVTKVTWDNPALISRRTAERLGIKTGRKLGGPQYNKVAWATVTVRDATLDIPVWVQPGMADDVIHLPLGYGRRHGGRIARDTGFDAFAIRPLGGWSYATGGSVEPARGRSPYLIATTQDHWSLEGRAILREVDLEHWKKHGDKVIERKDAYGNKEKMHPANALGMEGHTPLNRDVYLQRPGRRGSSIFYHKVDDQGQAILDDKGRKQHPLNKWDKPVQQWGMSIDMTTCTGCNACVIACQAENNIPIVGKKEVAKGREMHWIRVDRYYASDRMDDSAFDAPDMGLQPMPCVHCENAPCEVVCPVNATVHSTEGTNDMAYNRCIGTRYCANNCPYKVRRFNLFDYATKKFMGDFKGIVGIGDQDGGVPNEGIPGVVNNENFIPPRLREKVSDVESMQRNPNVTIRSRGVMEKCTYCLQRINAARVETKLEDLDMIPDGFFQVACQQACPTGAITFGDIYDYVSNDGAGSVVSQAKADLRTYAVLGYLNIVPRTTHMLRVRNPNHDIRPAGPDPFEHGHGHDDEYGPERKEEGHVMSLPILQSAGALA